MMDGAEIFLDRLKEILRTEHRNSPHGAKIGSACSVLILVGVMGLLLENSSLAIL